jgi:hypothetical protein
LFVGTAVDKLRLAVLVEQVDRLHREGSKPPVLEQRAGRLAPEIGLVLLREQDRCARLRSASTVSGS